MSKPSAPRREADNEAKAVLRTIRVSPRKLDLVAATIRGKKAASAVNELTFSKKRIAQDVKKALNSAIANAESREELSASRARMPASSYRPRYSSNSARYAAAVAFSRGVQPGAASADSYSVSAVADRPAAAR